MRALPSSPRRKLAGCAAIFVLSVGVLIAFLIPKSPPDPVVQGRPYSHWLRRLIPSTATSFTTASNVVNDVGTNGFPLLRAYLTSRDSKLRLFLFHNGVGTEGFVAATQLQVSACNAVAVLGDKSAPLMPLVEPLLTNADGSVRLAAFRAVAANSLDLPNQYSIFTNAAANDPVLICRIHAAAALLRRGTEADEVLRLLTSSSVNRLHSPREIRAFVWMLQQLQFPEEQISRWLRSWANSPDVFTRRFAAEMISGPISLNRDRVRLLEQLSRDTNFYVSRPAHEGLRKLRSSSENKNSP